MKRFFFLATIILFLRIVANSQITLDFQSPLMNLNPTKLSNNETKYYLYDPSSLYQNNAFSLYNMDGSLFKVVQLPAAPGSLVGIFGPYYISRSLFDNDPSNIEYIIEYNCDSIDFGYQMRETKVIREDGTVLLDEKYGSISSSPAWVFATEEGTKLMLSPYKYANGAPLTNLTKVFSLPGELPTSVKDINHDFESSSLIYPNPNNGSFIINIENGKNDNSQIEVYSMTGKLIRTFTSSCNSTKVSDLDLPSGMYFLNIKTSQTSSKTKFIIQK
jgi:hypothetical protein